MADANAEEQANLLSAEDGGGLENVRLGNERDGEKRDSPAPAASGVQQPPEEEEEVLTPEEHADVVLAILKPVAITMLIVIWAVRTINLPQQSSVGLVMVYNEQATDSTGTKAVGSIVNALLFVGMIVFTTVIFVVLYKYRCLKVIFGWLIGSSGLMLGLFGGLLFYFILDAYNLPIDYFTFGFLVWNFMVVGVVSVFWFAPQRLNQAYLIFISALMAIFFTQLPEWTTWAILAAIAIYDIFAVLCPGGPLKVLVETAQERQEPIPALLYNGSVCITMADRDVPLQPPPEEDKKSVKLGLGDFVFYSVLIGRAAMFDVISVFMCFLAIIAGLFMTLLLLAVFRKALPALPISIFLGIVFFLLSKVFVLPFVQFIGSQSVFI